MKTQKNAEEPHEILEGYGWTREELWLNYCAQKDVINDLETELRKYEKVMTRCHRDNTRARRSLLRAWEAVARAREGQEHEAGCWSVTEEDVVRHRRFSARYWRFANACKDKLKQMETLNK